MSADWHFAFLMPSLAFREPIQNEHLAIVPFPDSRLKSLTKSQPAVKKLLSNFRDQFGTRIKPSAMLIHSNAPSSVDFQAVIAFRNTVAISSIIDARSIQLGGGNAGYPVWSDYFDFYPYTATKQGNEISGRSVANFELQKPEKFSGQRSAHLPDASRLSFGIDESTLEGCLKMWNRRFIKGRKERASTVLFRSLEIGCQANRVPAVGNRQPSIHDIGVGISLWVSALEILCHPGTSDVNREEVLEKLAQADWDSSNLKAKRYTLKNRNGRVLRDSSRNIRKFNFIQRLCAELYRARNDFLHGNSVSIGSLFPACASSGINLLSCAPLIYRAALSSFLPSTLNKAKKGDLAAQLQEWLKHSRKQGNYEKAVRAVQKATQGKS